MRLACSAVASRSRRCLQAAKHFYPEFVANQQRGLSGKEALGRRLQRELCHRQRGVPAQDFDQRLALAGRYRWAQFHGIVDKPIAAQSEKCHVSEVAVRGPTQDSDGVLVG